MIRYIAQAQGLELSLIHMICKLGSKILLVHIQSFNFKFVLIYPSILQIGNNLTPIKKMLLNSMVFLMYLNR